MGEKVDGPGEARAMSNDTQSTPTETDRLREQAEILCRFIKQEFEQHELPIGVFAILTEIIPNG